MGNGIRCLATVALSVGLLLPGTADCEVMFVAAGYQVGEPRMAELEAHLGVRGIGSLERKGAAGFYGTVDLFWVVPSARWLWLNGTYRYHAAEAAGDVEFALSSHTLELSPALYMDLFLPVWYFGAGPAATRTETRGPPDLVGADWAVGGHLFTGVAWPLAPALARRGHRVAIALEGRWQFATRRTVGAAAVDDNGLRIRAGLAYLPDEGRRIVNWAW